MSFEEIQAMFPAALSLITTWILGVCMVKAQKRTAAVGWLVQFTALFLVVFGVILMVIPAMPCEPFEMPVGSRHSRAYVTVDTWNLALPILLSLLLGSMTLCGS